MFPVLPYRNPNFSTVVYWEGFLNDDQISEINNFPQWKELEEAKIGVSHDEDENCLDYRVRKSKISWLRPDTSNLWLFHSLSHVVSIVNATHYNFDLTHMSEGIQLTYYDDKDQGFYGWHTDGGDGMKQTLQRKLSLSLLISDPKDFEGGEFQVLSDSIEPLVLEQKKGRAWLFPSYSLHKVAPVTKGIRKSLVVWVGGPPFK